MVKVYHLEKEYNSEHLLGKFLDFDSYDVLLNEDADVYRPQGFGDNYDERSLLLKFRKNAFTPEQVKDTYEGLRQGATLTDNRGVAAGADRTAAYQHMPTGLGSRRWVTKREKAVIEYFAKGSPESLYGDLAQEIYDETPNVPLEGRGGGAAAPGITIRGGSIWIVKVAHEIDFDEWFRATIKLNQAERKEAALSLSKKYLSDTTYGEGVNSGVGGYFDRYPRIPFCRETSWSAGNRDKFEKAYPLMRAANSIYKELVPGRWQGQYEEAQKLDKDWRIGGSVYTTVTINKQFRTACHRDVGDLCEDGSQNNPKGFSNLTVVSNGKNFDGFYLVFPEYRVAANIQAGDFIMMDAHKIHGNTPIKTMDEGFERLSLVFYFREAMLGCGSRIYEDLRRQFVYTRKDNAEHPDWHPGWNGVSPGMFYSQEWREYLYNNGLPEEAQKLEREHV